MAHTVHHPLLLHHQKKDTHLCAVHCLHHAQVWHSLQQLLDLVGLKVADKVPLDVSGEQRSLVYQLLLVCLLSCGGKRWWLVVGRQPRFANMLLLLLLLRALPISSPLPRCLTTTTLNRPRPPPHKHNTHLHIVLPKHALPSIIRLLHGLNWLRLAHSNQTRLGVREVGQRRRGRGCGEKKCGSGMGACCEGASQLPMLPPVWMP